MPLRTTVAVSLLIAGVGAAAVSASACSSKHDAPEPIHSSSEANVYAGPHLAWFNKRDQSISVWILNGTTVMGKQALAANRDAGDTDDPVLGTFQNSIVYRERFYGYVSQDFFANDGSKAGSDTYTWRCDDTNCIQQGWAYVGMVTFVSPCPPGQLVCQKKGVLWHNRQTGEVSMWNTSGYQVTGKTFVNKTCGAGCSETWQALKTADFNGDGNSDILWYNSATGQLSVWELDSQGTVLANPLVDWVCESGCAGQWSIVAADDTNTDGHADVLWWNMQTGKLSTWLLDGNGHVIDNPDLSWTCDLASGCANDWVPIGYMRFPPKL